MKVLIFAEFYLPGYKAGGPIRTLANLIERLGEEFEFKVVALDRDFLDKQSYPGIRPGAWNTIGNTDVFYLSPKNISFSVIRKILRETDYDVLYLNSYFSPEFTAIPIFLRWLGLTPRKPLILAPRGEFSPSALNIKNLKKRFYLFVAKALDLYQGVIWQASSEYEAADLRKEFGSKQNIQIAVDVPLGTVATVESPGISLQKSPGLLNVLFLSRVSKMKNLLGALDMLQGVSGEVSFDIYGILEDAEYWASCQNVIKRLPANIHVNYKGVAPHDQIKDIFSQYHLFFLPTLGENFGHAIFEALVYGCPVLISDRTQWRDLAGMNVGWDLPLENPEKFAEILTRCVNMGHDEYERLSKNARRYGRELMQSQDILEQNRRLFISALSKNN